MPLTNQMMGVYSTLICDLALLFYSLETRAEMAINPHRYSSKNE